LTRSDPSATAVLAGRKPVLDALAAQPERLEKVLIQKGARGQGIDVVQGTARAAGVPVQFVPKGRLEREVGGGVNHQGVAAVMAALAYRDADELLSEIAPTNADVRERAPLLLLLDQIHDPYNYGAMIRTAVAAGVAGIFVPDRNMAPLNAAALKTSAGTALEARIARVPNLADLCEALKERGYWIAGAEGGGEATVWDYDWSRPTALVMGSEEKGLRPRVADTCDALVSIPMLGPAESLNASVACGVLLFAATQSRLPGSSG
jgi:23S rRNA (guanosine2251-2'-O)-methyltransferase